MTEHQLDLFGVAENIAARRAAAEMPRFRFRILEHGPESSSHVACQYGTSGACEEGRHKECAHNPGGWQHAGCARAEDSLRHKVDGYWFAVMDSDGMPVYLLPMHVWRCSCSCHLAHRIAEAAR